MDYKALIETALGGQVTAFRFDREHNDFDVTIHYPDPQPVTFNWTLIRRIDFDNHLVTGRISLVQLTRFVDDSHKELLKAIQSS